MVYYAVTTPFVLIGEAWGEQEARFASPFLGPAGQELSRMLSQAGFGNELLPYNFTSAARMMYYWDKCKFPLLNVFDARPEGNNVELFFAPADDPAADRRFPVRRFGTSNYYVCKSMSHHVSALHAKLADLKPNVIIALGNTALWALGLPATIGKLRGNIVESKHGKVIPTYHPANILRNWANRTISVLDLNKARRESAYPDIRVPSRIIWPEPTIEDLYTWWDQHGKTCSLLAFDIETVRKTQVAEIGIASSPHMALHIPFVYRDDGQYISYWPDLETEAAAWDFVRMVCESPVPKIGQNVVQYDAYFMAKALGIPVLNIQHDTMTLAHAWQPELQKSLGFLGSLFLTEREWKSIRINTDKGDD